MVVVNRYSPLFVSRLLKLGGVVADDHCWIKGLPKPAIIQPKYQKLQLTALRRCTIAHRKIRMWLAYQTWLFLLKTCFHQWTPRSHHCKSYVGVRIWIDEVFSSKEEAFYIIHKLPERWWRCVASESRYIEWNIFLHSITKMCFRRSKHRK